MSLDVKSGNGRAMNIDEYRSLVLDVKWQAASTTIKNSISDQWLEWLLHRGSLTKKLTDYAGGEFGLQVLSEQWGTPVNYESNKLGLTVPQWSMIREVELSCRGVPTVFARSIIPHHVYQENKTTLAAMGSKPLGHFLSRSALLQPSMRDICQFQSSRGDHSYGRGTLYNYNSGTILVQEFFIDSSIAS